MGLGTQHVLSHEQQAPLRQVMHQNDRRLMPPPPTPLTNGQPSNIAQARQTQRIMTPRITNQMQFNHSKLSLFRNASSSLILVTPGQSYVQAQQVPGQGVNQFHPTGQAPRRFIARDVSGSGQGNQLRIPSTPSGGQRHFVASTPTVGSGRRFVPSSSSGTIRGSTQNGDFVNGNAQRSTFAPQR